ncbi:MAG TPA: hypothetical protein DIV79_15800 [Opitutae bacterium]|nr:hypothetical protein [Opitutaceae bacterium]HCR31469.1 hypothetical protein [Opitutae bacterium]
MMRAFGSGLAVTALIAMLVSGCSRPTVEVYDVPKAESSTAPSLTEQSTQPSSPEDRGWIRWSKPEPWTELAPTAFRKGNYLFEGDSGNGKVEITVSSFPGDVGGTLANVNRWRGQAGLGPVSQSELAASLTELTIDGNAGQLVDILPEGDDPQAARIVAAIFMYRGESWFFKMSGPQSLVDGQKPVFDTFIETLEFTGANAAKSQDSEISESRPLALAFDTPEGWTESSGSSFRIASFQIDLEGFEPGDFSITRFPGDAGGIHANVNRWRQQIGLSNWSEKQVEERGREIAAGELKFALYDLAPRTEAEKENVQERILAAVMEHYGQSYFFKLRGEIFLVETQRNKFLQLLRSTRFETESP